MTHRLAPRRLLSALRNAAVGIALIVTPILLFLGVAGPGQAAEAATNTTPATIYDLQVKDAGGGYEFTQLVKLTTSDPAKIVLSGPLENDTALWAWYQGERAGTIGRMNLTLTKITNGTLAEEWGLNGARLSRLEVTGLKAGSTTTAKLTVTIVAKTVTILSEP